MNIFTFLFPLICLTLFGSCSFSKGESILGEEKQAFQETQKEREKVGENGENFWSRDL